MTVEHQSSTLALFCHSIVVPLSKNDRAKVPARSMAGRTGVPLGAHAVAPELCRALIDHSDSSEILLVGCRNSHLDPPTEHWDSMLRKGAASDRTHICTLRQLAPTSTSRVVWFEPAGLAPWYHDLRHLHETTFPITFVHHTISYRRQLVDTFVPLLLSSTLPCDSLICTSNASKKALENIFEYLSDAVQSPACRYNGRLCVIPFGIDINRFKPVDSTQCRIIFNLPRQRPVLLYFGRISVSDKADLSPLLLAFREAVSRMTPEKPLLVIAGNARGNELDTLHDLVRHLDLKESVRFLHHISHAEKPYLYCAADVFVSPVDSVQECFGLSVLEAMACGVPQIVSDWSGYRETVVDGKTGFLIPTYWAPCDAPIIKESTDFGPILQDHFELGQSVCVDVAALADRIVDLLLNKDLRRSMARESRERACRNYDWKVVISMYDELWSELRNIAHAMVAGRGARSSISVPAYHRTFKHFASMTVGEAWRVAPGPKQGTSNSQFWPRTSFLNLDPMSLLTLAESFFQTKSETRVADLLELFPAPERDEVMRTIMFLAKHGYVVLQSPRLSEPVAQASKISASAELDQPLGFQEDNRFRPVVGNH